MNRKFVFLFSLGIFMFFEECSSAIHWMFDDYTDESEAEDYEISRKASVYRGFLLSLSADQKHEMCRDCFHRQIFREFYPPGTEGQRIPRDQNRFQSRIIDGVTTVGPPQHPLTVVKMEVKKKRPETGTEDLMFKCVGRNFPFRATDFDLDMYLTYAFRSDWMFSVFPSSDHGKPEAAIVWYIGMAPKYVEMNPATLEDEYVDNRRRIKTLEKESPQYIELVEKRDDLSELTEKQLRFLCGSILATPTFRDEGLEFSFDWISDDLQTMKFEKKLLTFQNEAYNKDKWEANCVYCKAFFNGDNYIGAYENLYITRTLDNKNSVLVLKYKDGNLFLHKYFRNIHILKNVHENITDRTLYEYF